jgi:hypothetical protein
VKVRCHHVQKKKIPEEEAFAEKKNKQRKHKQNGGGLELR